MEGLVLIYLVSSRRETLLCLLAVTVSSLMMHLFKDFSLDFK